MGTAITVDTAGAVVIDGTLRTVGTDVESKGLSLFQEHLAVNVAARTAVTAGRGQRNQDRTGQSDAAVGTLAAPKLQKIIARFFNGYVAVLRSSTDTGMVVMGEICRQIHLNGIGSVAVITGRACNFVIDTVHKFDLRGGDGIHSGNRCCRYRGDQIEAGNIRQQHGKAQDRRKNTFIEF